MNIFYKQLTKFHWAVFLLAAFSLHAGAPVDTERATELKVTTIGTRLAGAVLIPAYSVDTRTGLDLSPEDRAFLAELPVLPRTIKAKSVSWVYLTGYGWLLIPRGWIVVDGGVGADGSMALLAQSKSGISWLEYSDAGNCVGCAITAASCFYPQAHAQALDYDFDTTECGKSGATQAAAPRAPALQYQLHNSKGARLQTLRNYSDVDGISYQQLRVHQPNLPHAGSAAEIDLKNHALGIFFKRIWIAPE